MKSAKNVLDLEMKNLLDESLREKNLTKKIELCDKIIDSYLENNKNPLEEIVSNDTVSDAYYYKAFFIGGNYSVIPDNGQDNVVSFAELKEFEGDSNSLMGGSDPAGANELRIKMSELLEKSIMIAKTENQKNKCQWFLIRHYVYLALKVIKDNRDIYKSIDFCKKLIETVTFMTHDSIKVLSEPINFLVRFFESEIMHNLLIENFSPLEKAAVQNITEQIKIIQKQHQLNDTEGFDDRTKKIKNVNGEQPEENEFGRSSEIEYLYRELLIKTLEGLTLIENKEIISEDEANDIAIYNKALLTMKKAANLISKNEDDKYTLNLEQINSFALSEEARKYLDTILFKGMNEEKAILSDRCCYIRKKFNPDIYYLRALAYFYSGKTRWARNNIEEHLKYCINGVFDAIYQEDHDYRNNFNCIDDILKYTKKINIGDNVEEAFVKRGLARIFLNENMIIKDVQRHKGLFTDNELFIIQKEIEGNQIEKSENDFSCALMINAKNVEAYKNTGLLYDYIARIAYKYNISTINVRASFSKAIANYRESLKNRKDAYTFYHLANCLKKNGLVKMAINSYKKAAKLARNNTNLLTNIFINLGDTYASFNKHSASIKYGRKAENLGSKSPPLFNNIGISYSMGITKNPERAIRYLEKAVMLSPRYIDAIGGLAAVYAETKKFNDAIEYFTLAIRLSGDYEKLQSIREKLNDDEKFVVSFFTLWSPPENYLRASYFLNRGKCFYFSKQLDMAIADFKECIEYARNATKGIVNLGKLNSIIDEADEALRHCNWQKNNGTA